MGVYVYSIRSPKHVTRVELDTGQVMTVARYAFSHKPYYSAFDREPRWQVLARARINRMHNIWEKHVKAGGVWPDGGIVVCDDNKIIPGQPVLKWSYNDSHLPSCMDDYGWANGKEIGKVVREI